MNSRLPKLHRLPTASKVRNALNGVFVVYKPECLPFSRLRATLIYRLTKELNAMHVRHPVQHVSIEGDTNQEMKVVIHNSYADDPLVAGPRYVTDDIKLSAANLMETDTCGVLVCGINKGTTLVSRIWKSAPTRFYRVRGILGESTDNYFKTGKVVEKSTYDHVKRPIIDKLCSSMQSSHQRKMFELNGVDPQSQAAYELAIAGPIRPSNPNIPMIYTIKCVDYTPPEFTLEIVCINEYEMYLKTIIHDLGIQLHTNATCTQIQCFQYGLFRLQHALLSKYWTTRDVIRNIRDCTEIIKKNRYLLKQHSPTLIDVNDR